MQSHSYDHSHNVNDDGHNQDHLTKARVLLRGKFHELPGRAALSVVLRGRNLRIPLVSDLLGEISLRRADVLAESAL